MLVASSFEASRNWSSILSRLGFGVVALGILDALNVISLEFQEVGNANNWETAPKFIFALLASMLIGGILVSIGSFGKGKKFGELAKAKRAHKIGLTGNPLLAEMFRDANQKYEIASGFISLLYFGALAAFLFWLFGEPTDVNALVPTNESSKLSRVIFGALGVISGMAVRYSATNSIEALDELLDEAIDKVGSPKPAETPNGQL